MQWSHASQKRIKAVCLAGFVGLLAVCLSVSTGQAQQEEIIAAGKQVYAKYCANCHGQEAKGDGSVAKLFTLRSVDLRELAIRNNGVFPFWEVYRVIDGRKEIKAHGPREMPVWGITFRYEVDLESPLIESPLAETHVRGRIFELMCYLESIQETQAERSE